MLKIKFNKAIQLQFKVKYSTVPRVNQQLKSWKEIPGPKSFPIIKQAYNFIPGIGVLSGKDLLGTAKYFHENFGPIVRFDGVFGVKPQIFLYDPNAIEHILRSEDSMPLRPGFESIAYFKKKHNRFEEEKRPTGLLTEQGDNWKLLRSTVNPVMLQSARIKSYKIVFEDVATDMIQRLKSIRNDKKMVDKFDLEIKKWSLESIGTVALGGRIGCLDPNLPEESKAQQLIQCIDQLFKTVEKLDFKPNLWNYFSTRSFTKGMTLYQNIYDLSKYFICRARKDLKSKKKYHEKGVLEKLLEIDERTALTMASEMLTGGVENVTMATIGALYFLGTNRDIQQKLREELKFSDNKQSYLKACLKEAQRCMPVAPGNARITTKEYELLGYVIPKGTMVAFFHHYLSTLDDQYPKAKEFIPERWLVDKSDPLYYGNAHPFTTLPFGYGTRMCIGKRIAELEIEILIAKLIENFDIEWLGPPPKIETTLVNYIQGPYNFVFKDM